MSGRRPGPLGAHEHSHHARHGAHHAHHGPHQQPYAGRHPLGQHTRLQPSDLSSDNSIREYVEMHPLTGGLTASLLEQAVPGVGDARASQWVAHLNVACREFEITRSIRRMAAFLGHVAHESGSLHKVKENPYYKDARRINNIFGAFSTEAEAEPYIGRPEALANKAYANSNGNGDEASGDGWKYRGRGLIQVTGRGNYAALAKDLDLDVVNDPDLLATPKYAALSAGWYWKKRGLNQLADAQMYQALSRKINKKLDSFPQREARRLRALDVLTRAILTDMTLSIVHRNFGGLF